jgi:hypothetical protein
MDSARKRLKGPLALSLALAFGSFIIGRAPVLLLFATIFSAIWCGLVVRGFIIYGLRGFWFLLGAPAAIVWPMFWVLLFTGHVDFRGGSGCSPIAGQQCIRIVFIFGSH